MNPTDPDPCCLPDRPRNHVQVRSAGGVTGKLLIDDMDVSAATKGFNLSMGYGDHPRMVIDIAAFPLTLDIEECSVYLKPECHALLVQLGWTPPPEPNMPEEGVNELD